jgi:hypothetical protein
MGFDAAVRLDPADAESARGKLREGLTRFAQVVAAEGRDAAIDVLCVAVEGIPVPFLNGVLSRAVRRMLQGRDDARPEDIDEVLRLLDDMQSSNEEFERGLDRLRIDHADMAADIRDIRQWIAQAQTSRLGFRRGRAEHRWPVFDNRISGILANRGGGSVVVDEIVVHVEGFEAEPAVNYTVPAAPPLDLYLQAELRTDTADYPLLELNGEPERLFGPNLQGAERIFVDLSSRENVRYRLRLQIQFEDMATDTSDVLVWPAADEPPVTLAFACSPGWKEVKPEELHAADAVYRDMAEKLGGLADALAARPPTDEYDPELEARLDALGLCGVAAYARGGWLFRSFLERFVPLYAQIAPAAERGRALAIVAALLAAAPADSLAELDDASRLPPSLVELARGTPVEQRVSELAARLDDPGARAALRELVVPS